MAASHRELTVWHKAMDVAVQVYRITDRFPRHELYRLTSQLTRAAASVPANIAEGNGRGTRRDYAHFLQGLAQRDRDLPVPGDAPRLPARAGRRTDAQPHYGGRQDAHNPARAPRMIAVAPYSLFPIPYSLFPKPVGTRRDYAHFLSIAKGSLNETETFLFLAMRLGYLHEQDAAPTLGLITEVGKMLTTLHARLA